MSFAPQIIKVSAVKLRATILSQKSHRGSGAVLPF